MARLLPFIALTTSASAADTSHAEAAAPPHTIYIREYRVIGSQPLSPIEVQQTVYPFLGPGRTEADVEEARAALEKAYHEKGWQAASVQIPEQTGRGGIVFLQVSEGKVARLRVKGARYFLPSHIKARAQSLAEGRAINFKNVTRDIVALNQLANRQVTPSLRAGEEPGTVDVDLTVADKLPLHGSVELNNRYSADTTPLRLNASLSYNNLWQLGHTIGASYQVAPERRKDSEVWAGYYIARFPGAEGFSLMLDARKQKSEVSALGAFNVASPGESVGLRGIVTLPSGKDFFHSFTMGADYKRYEQDTDFGGTVESLPITYYPITASYGATWAPKGSVSELNTSLVFGIRGANGEASEFANKRFDAASNFIYLRGELSHTRDLPRGFEVFGKVQGQIANRPLVNSEQFAGGGLSTARGYLEAEALGDNAVFGTLELRSPSLLWWLPAGWKGNEWRIFVFGDMGALSLRSPLPEQENSFQLASYGVGSRIQLATHLNGSVDYAIPAISEGTTHAHDPFLSFRVWADF